MLPLCLAPALVDCNAPGRRSGGASGRADGFLGLWAQLDTTYDGIQAPQSDVPAVYDVNPNWTCVFNHSGEVATSTFTGSSRQPQARCPQRHALMRLLCLSRQLRSAVRRALCVCAICLGSTVAARPGPPALLRAAGAASTVTVELQYDGDTAPAVSPLLACAECLGVLQPLQGAWSS